MSKILVLSNSPWSVSGYGTQCAQIVPRIASLGHDVAVVAFYGLAGAPLYWGDRDHPVMVYPGSTEDPWAQDVLPGHYEHHGADLLITLMDAWVLNPVCLKMMQNVAHWMPVDCSPLSAGDRNILAEGGGRPIAMSEFGRRQLLDAGWESLYVPHAVDTQEVFTPLPDRDAIRQELELGGTFLVGINAANIQDTPRKGLPEQLEAFAQFRSRHPEARLTVHARAETTQGTSLGALCAEFGLGPDAVQYCDQYLYAAGLIGQDKMARWYSMLDVLSNCSYGEGFGLAALEAQACGTPVVTTDASAMTEMCGSGWLVESSRFWQKGHRAWWARPSVAAIAEAYEEAFALWQSGGLGSYREKAREFAIQYDADRVLADFWVPALAELCA